VYIPCEALRLVLNNKWVAISPLKEAYTVPQDIGSSSHGLS
jgi:hypothetical protein